MRTFARTLIGIVGFVLLIFFFAEKPAQAQCNLTNGDFETGNLTGWTVYTRVSSGGTANWFNYGGTVSPFSAHTISAPPQGTRGAVVDQNQASVNELYQDFTLPAGQSGTLTFYLAYNNTLSSFINPTPDTLDYTNSQQARVDLIKTAAPNETVAPSDVYVKLFQTKPGDPFIKTPTLMTYDVSGFAGLTTRLRFVESVGFSWLNFQVDNVCLSTTRTTITRTTPVGASVSTDIGDVHLFMPAVTAAGTTSVQQLDPAVQTGPPTGVTFTGPAFDISTAATFTGNATVCFFLPNVTDATAFQKLRMLHKEGGVWVNLSSSAANFTARELCGVVSSLSPFAVGSSTGAPTSGEAKISGRISGADGSPLGGAVLQLSGGAERTAITDSEGNYSFLNLEAGDFYTVTPSLANFHFAPGSRSISLLSNQADASFSGDADASASANAIDTPEYFIRQQYLDFLGREPEPEGLWYWSDQIHQCNGDTTCVRQRRIDVSAAFFMSGEFQDTGSYVYDLFAGLLGRRPDYTEFKSDRSQVVGGAGLDAAKTALAAAFAQRQEFISRYPQSMTRDQFVDAVLQTMQQRSGVDLSSQRDSLLAHYDTGGRTLVVRDAAENGTFIAAEYNKAFVLMEYFGYLRRGEDQNGYDFWLNTLNQALGNNYRGMVCSFLTSAEYQTRFGTLVTHNNQECQ